jgi:hypothetical protein
MYFSEAELEGLPVVAEIKTEPDDVCIVGSERASRG